MLVNLFVVVVVVAGGSNANSVSEGITNYHISVHVSYVVSYVSEKNLVCVIW